MGLEETKDHRVREYFSRLKRNETERIKSTPTCCRLYFDRLQWNMLIFLPCPTPYVSVLDKGKLPLCNCFLPSIPTFHYKKLFHSDRIVGKIICAICTNWSVFLPICSGVAQYAPFINEFIEAGVFDAFCVRGAASGFVSVRHPPTCPPVIQLIVLSN